ncbi:hypothetical protein S83_012066, partial [Arachis hypogaea]
KVTNFGISFLKGLQKLSLLNLEGCLVTAACLDSLARRSKSSSSSPTASLLSSASLVRDFTTGDKNSVSPIFSCTVLLHKITKHFVRTCPLLAKEDSPAEYSNVEDETMGCRSKKSVSKLTETPKIRANSKKSRQKTEEITLTQETLKDKTNTSGIEVTKVPDAATTKIPGLPQYPMHHYPVVLPYQPYGGVLPIPFILFQMTWRTSTNILLLPELHHILSFLMSRRILVDPLSLRLQVLSLCCTGSKAINDPKVLLQKSLDAPDPQVVEDAWNTLVQMRALEKIPMGRYEPTFYGQLIASCPLSFDASVLVLKFGNAGMIRERSLVGIMMDTQPIPILHPFGEDILVMPEWINITISNCTDSMLQFL